MILKGKKFSTRGFRCSDAAMVVFVVVPHPVVVPLVSLSLRQVV
jgi:hypothetical protein